MKLIAKLSKLASTFGKTFLSLETDCAPDELEQYADKDLDIEIKVHRDKRSVDANKRLWATLKDWADAIQPSMPGMTDWDLYIEEVSRYGVLADTVDVFEEAYPMLQELYRATKIVEVKYASVSCGYDAAGYPIMEDKKVYTVNCYLGSSQYDTKQFSTLLHGVIDDMEAQGIPSYEMRKLLDDVTKHSKHS